MASVSIRYAKALADVVIEKREHAVVTAELESFAAILRESRDLGNVLTNPAVPILQKRNLLDALAQRLSYHGTTRNFLKIIADHRRFPVFPEILAAFRHEVDQRLGIESVEVTSAAALDESEKSTLAERLRAFTHQEVRLHFQTDPALIGGMVTQIGSTIYDGSLREQLRQLQRELSGG